MTEAIIPTMTIDASMLAEAPAPPPKPTAQFACFKCGASNDFLVKMLGHRPRVGEDILQCAGCNAINAFGENGLEDPNAPQAPAEAETAPVQVTQIPRECFTTGLPTLDRELGASMTGEPVGLVGGSIYLVRGVPGIGKSRFALQIALASSNDKTIVLVNPASKDTALALADTVPGSWGTGRISIQGGHGIAAADRLDPSFRIVVLDDLSLNSPDMATRILSGIARKTRDAGAVLIVTWNPPRDGASEALVDLDAHVRHYVDVILNIERTPHGDRVVKIGKNKHGPMDVTSKVIFVDGTFCEPLPPGVLSGGLFGP